MRLFIFIFLSFGLFVGVVQLTTAQQASAPEMVISWAAASSAGGGARTPLYKMLPTTGSDVDLAIAVFSNGRVVNLSGVKISWLLNGSLLESKMGLARTTASLTGNRSSHLIEVVIKNYPGTGDLREAITIPVLRP